MTRSVSVDFSAIMMSSCIQSCGDSTGCGLMFTDIRTHSFTLYAAQFPVPCLDLDLFCLGHYDTYYRVSLISGNRHFLKS